MGGGIEAASGEIIPVTEYDRLVQMTTALIAKGQRPSIRVRDHQL